MENGTNQMAQALNFGPTGNEEIDPDGAQS
jgi:hypothetical protein